MKRIAPIVISLMGLAGGAFAQTVTDPIQKALLAAPARAKKEEITVIKWKPDFTYETLQKGSGTMVCYDLSGFPGHPPFTVECTSMANLPRVAQNLKYEAMGDRKTVQMDAGKSGKGWYQGEARVRIGVHPLHGARSGTRFSPHHHRGAGRNGAISRIAG